MKKRKWTRAEVDTWRRNHPGSLYVNKEDGNLFVRKRCGGINWTFNWGNPASWVVTVAITAVIVLLAQIL